MNTSTLRLCLALFIAAGLSCNDQGDVINYLEIVDLTPAPNSLRVDKATFVQIRFSAGVNWDQGEKIEMRYVDDTSRVNSFSGCGLVPPVGEWVCTGPYIWKPGRTVEVTIPKEISDPEGHSLRRPLTYRFTVARDTLPFDLIDTRPAQNDTVSLGGSYHIVHCDLTFSDYTIVQDSVLSIDPPATLQRGGFVCESRNTPSRLAWFIVSNLQPYTTYTITVPRAIRDYEGEMLARVHHIVFHTKP